MLTFATTDVARVVEVRRNDEVSDDFWRVVRSEWGQRGPQPSTAIRVPIETFASRNRWLLPACRRHRVSISWDDITREVIRRQADDRRKLVDIQEKAPTLDEDAALERLGEVSQAGFDGDLDSRFCPGESRGSIDVIPEEVSRRVA